MEIERRLSDLGLELPQPGTPAGTYIGCVQVDNLLFVGGNIGRINGVLKYSGKVGAEVTIEQGYEMARNVCLNHLTTMKRYLGDLDRVERIVKVVGYVNVAEGGQRGIRPAGAALGRARRAHARGHRHRLSGPERPRRMRGHRPHSAVVRNRSAASLSAGTSRSATRRRDRLRPVEALG